MVLDCTFRRTWPDSDVRSKRIFGRLQRAQDATGGQVSVQEDTVIQKKSSHLVQQNSAAEEGAADSPPDSETRKRCIGAFSSKPIFKHQATPPPTPPPPPPVSMPKALQPLASVCPTVTGITRFI